MSASIVAEEPFAAGLLRRLLSPEIRGTAAVLEGGRGYEALSLAISLFADGKLPVVLLFETETAAELGMGDPYVSEDLLHTSSGFSLLLYAEPSIESVLFHDRQALARVLGVEISPEEGLLAQFRPRQVLDTLIRRSAAVQNREQLLDALDERAAARFAEHPLIARIQEFIPAATGRLASQNQGSRTRLRKTG